MSVKRRYVVSFLKTVTDDYGHDQQIRQHAIEVFSESKEEAVEQAKAELCRLEHLSDWSQHADRYEVAEPDFPS